MDISSTEHAPPALRAARRLVGCYVTLSVLAVVAIVSLRDDPAVVDATVWIRGVAIAAASLLSFVFATRAARGSRGALRRLRIAAAVQVVAVAVIVALPGVIPVWMRIEQGACGLLLVGVVVLTSRLRQS